MTGGGRVAAGFLSDDEVLGRAEALAKSGYGEYLAQLAERGR